MTRAIFCVINLHKGDLYVYRNFHKLIRSSSRIIISSPSLSNAKHLIRCLESLTVGRVGALRCICLSRIRAQGNEGSRPYCPRHFLTSLFHSRNTASATMSSTAAGIAQSPWRSRGIVYSGVLYYGSSSASCTGSK